MTQAALDGHEIDYRRLGQDMLALLSKFKNGNLHPTFGTVVGAKNIAFDFAGLPAEIRNEIYRYALCAETPIEILRHTRSSVWCERVEDRWLMDKSIGKYRPKPRTELSATFNHLMLLIRERTLPYGLHYAPALLRVNRQVNTEATPIFYGENTFVFPVTAGFKVFHKEIGKNFALLHHIVLKDFRTPRDNTLLLPLHAATKLQSLTLNIMDTSAGVSKRFLVADIWQAFARYVKGPDIIRCICDDAVPGCPRCRQTARIRRFAAVQLVVRGEEYDARAGRFGKTYEPSKFRHLKEEVRAVWRHDKLVPGP